MKSLINLLDVVPSIRPPVQTTTDGVSNESLAWFIILTFICVVLIIAVINIAVKLHKLTDRYNYNEELSSYNYPEKTAEANFSKNENHVTLSSEEIKLLSEYSNLSPQEKEIIMKIIKNTESNGKNR